MISIPDTRKYIRNRWTRAELCTLLPISLSRLSPLKIKIRPTTAVITV